MTSRVLIAWEFGSGLGHLACMYPIIRKLRERGCEPLVAVPDPDRAREVFGEDAPRLIPVVPFPMRRRPRGAPESFADLLLDRGFADTRALIESVRGWQAILRDEKIETVLLDYAHVAQLATWLMGLPMINCSTGFASPPVPIPCFRPGVPQSERATRVAEQRLLECINAVAKEFGREPIASLATWLHAPYRFTTGIRETNVYDFEPEGGYLGPLGNLPNVEPLDWPASDRTRVLCYLKWSKETPKLVEALKREDRDVACVIPGAPEEWLARAQGPLIRTTSRAVDLPALVSTADVVVSNGSAGLVCRAILAGKRQLLIPIDREKLLIAQKLARLGLAFVCDRLQMTPQLLDTLAMSESALTRLKDLSAQSHSSWQASLESLVDGQVKRPLATRSA